MINPWEGISLSDYENHMRLMSVRQLQTLNAIMKEQFALCPARSVMILGVAGGNGLEHARGRGFEAIFGVDVNEDYLKAVRERYRDLAPALRCLRLDLTADADRLPRAELVIADLVIEYIGCAAFARALRKAEPEAASCVIQIDEDTERWVSDSPYLHAFDGLETVHRRVDERALTDELLKAGYACTAREEYPLPGGKSFLRLDYGKTGAK